MKTGITFAAVDRLLDGVAEMPYTYVGVDMSHLPAFLRGMRMILAMEGYRVSPQVYRQACQEHGIRLAESPRADLGPTLINRFSLLQAYFAAETHEQTVAQTLIAIERTALMHVFQAGPQAIDLHPLTTRAVHHEPRGPHQHEQTD